MEISDHQQSVFVGRGRGFWNMVGCCHIANDGRMAMVPVEALSWFCLILNPPLPVNPERFYRSGKNIHCSFSSLAQRKRTKRKGALSLDPLDLSVLLERSGARGNSLRSDSPRAKSGPFCDARPRENGTLKQSVRICGH
jgi:hypothetical protein